MMRRFLILGLILALAAGSWVSRKQVEADWFGGPTEQELLYLPNGTYLKAISLGQAPVLADLVYLWAIQYYSDYEQEGRYLYVDHIFSKVIAELDPHYVDPYWLGALILIVEAEDLDGGLALLDAGIARNPTAWILPYLAGWEAYHGGLYRRAADYFQRASSVKGAPSFVKRMRAGMMARAGDLEEARSLWEQVLSDPGSDDAARAIARSRLRDLEVRIDLREIGKAVLAFRQRFGRNPRRLADLVRAGLLAELPSDPDGNPYPYDPATGRVESEGRILGGR